MTASNVFRRVCILGMLLWVCLCAPARAEALESLEVSMETVWEESQVRTSSAAMSDALYTQATRRIADAVERLEDVVDVGDLNLYFDDDDFFCSLTRVYQGARDDRPDLFWMSNDYTIRWDPTSKRVYEINLEYIVPKEQVPGMKAAYNARLQEVLGSIPSHYTTDLEKALYLHDYLVMNCRYDHNEGRDDLVYTSYAALCQGVSVCSGYAWAYNQLLDELGIPSRYVRTFDDFNHAWNMIQIDGQWYETDVTWDDPNIRTAADRDVTNYVLHDHFMVPTATMVFLHQEQGTNVYSFDPRPLPLCNADGFRGYAFRHAYFSSLGKKGDTWYWMDSHYRVMAGPLDGRNSRCVYEVTGYPVLGYFTRDKLYFSAGTSLYAWELEGGAAQLLHTFREGQQLEEFSVAGEDILLGYATPQGYQRECLPLSGLSPLVPEGWVQEEEGIRYYLDGVMQTGWLYWEGKWYYLQPQTGYRVSGWAADGGRWYYLNAAGVMQTGWILLDGAWYYLTGSGAMATGWLKLGQTWYYLQPSGAMETGWIKTGGKWYYLAPSGAMQTGWLLYGGEWYYLMPSGERFAYDWLEYKGEWYFLDGRGIMLRSAWYSIDGGVYYFTDSGACDMAVSIPPEGEA